MTSAVTAPTVDQLRAVTTVSVRKGGAWLGMSTASAYRAASDGSLPTIRVGKTLRVPTPRLLALVGLPYEVESEPFSGTDAQACAGKEYGDFLRHSVARADRSSPSPARTGGAGVSAACRVVPDRRG